jgi:hypothetical protein
MTYLERYFELQFEYESFYKEKVVILLQQENFYEIYEYNPDLCIDDHLKSTIYNKKIGCVSELSNILEFCSFSRGLQESHSINNPTIMVFPVRCCVKYINNILEHSYIVIKLERSKADPSLTHCVTEIIQPY